MPEVQEVFRMATQKVRPDAGFVGRQQDRQQRRQRNRKLGAFAVAGAICIAAVTVILVSSRGPSTTPPPLDGPSPTGITTIDQAATKAASNFAGALSTLDTERALALLAPGADIAGLTGTGSSASDLEQDFAWLGATGFTPEFGPCQQQVQGTSGTIVTCPFSFHGLRSDEIGVGPFGGSTLSVTVVDGRIVKASEYIEVEEFSPQMWEPFADWVSATYPKDAAVMYTQGLSMESHSDESNRLWEQHLKEYARDVAGSA
jgi:hypothetical protein